MQGRWFIRFFEGFILQALGFFRFQLLGFIVIVRIIHFLDEFIIVDARFIHLLPESVPGAGEFAIIHHEVLPQAVGFVLCK